MQQPSTNKWAVPLKSSKRSISFDSYCDTSDRLNNNNSNGISADPEKKYDPCVAFVSGTPLSNSGSRNSRSSSINSSGNATPLRTSGRVSPENKQPTKTFDPCVSFTAGKPNVDVPEETKSIGVPPIKLENALRKAQNKKVYSVGIRLAPKPIQGVNKPGAVNDIAGLFGGGNTGNRVESRPSIRTRKQSTTSVLRDDFQMKCAYKNQAREHNEDSEVISEENVSPHDSQKSPEQDLKPLSYKDTNRKTTFPSRKFSSSTSQATLIESLVVSPEDGVFAVVNPVTWKDESPKDYLSSPSTQKKGNRSTNDRKFSLSSVENSEDEDSHVDSAEENELNNWKGRRRSYLAAHAKQSEKNGFNLDATVEADDEDSDVNVNVFPKVSCQKSAEEDGMASTKVIIKEGPLNRKHAHANDRRRPVSRTWKPIYAVLKGHRLFCYKEGGSDADDEIVQPIPVRSSIIEIASDYVKKKNVFRMVTSHDNEYLFQAENAASMMDWVTALRGANPDKESLLKTTASVKQEQHCANSGQQSPTIKSPQIKEKNRGGSLIKKSTFGFVAGRKTRNANVTGRTPDEPNPPGKTFGTLLHLVPMSDQAKNVPVILYKCCTTILEKGINQTGLYRVPGNTATWNSLKEELDTKSPEEIDWEDEKWQELNNICSLVKTFLRELEDPIIPNSMYSKFIQANRIKDSSERLKTIKQLIWHLPEYHFESIDFLAHHLKTLADNCSKNSMSERNIALILAPNMVRSSEVSTMVQDMSDQYQIVELLIRQCDWIFDDSDECLSIPEEVENNSDNIIASSMKQNLMESISNSQQMVDIDNDIGSKKGNKFSSLKSNFSMRLRNNRNVSPRTTKKTKISPGGTPSQDEDDSDGDDTSESINTSPTLEVKAKPGFFKNSKEIMQNINSGTVIPLRRASLGATKIGSFQPNSEVTIQFKHRSPEGSPQLSRSDKFRAGEKGKKLSEKTLNRLNQLTVSRYDDYTKNAGKDDGSDSGLVSPARLDSDENMSGGNSDSGAQSCRKTSLDSLSGPSPSTKRRFNVARQPSSGSTVSSDERSSSHSNPSNTLNIWAPNDNSDVPQENRLEPGKPCVVKRSGRRANLTLSPRVSKRELCTIMPGDDSFEEKVRALIDPEYSGQLKEVATCEMNQPYVEPKTDVPPKRTFAPISLSLNMNESNDGPNADWWLSNNNSASSDNRNNTSRKTATRPKDKTSALSIISNAIDFRKRTEDKYSVNTVSENSPRSKNDTLSPAMARRIGPTQKLPYTPELTGRVDQYNIQKEECQKKVTDVLGPNVNEEIDSSNINTKSDQIQFYLEKVSKLLSDSDGLDKEAPQINDILKSFQSKVKSTVPPSSPSKQRSTDELSTNNDAISINPTQKNSRTNECNTLNSPYSNSEYNKLYAR